VYVLKNCTSSKLAHLLHAASKFALFSVSGLKDEKLILKTTYMKTETCKLYSRVFWIFLLNFMKIDRYIFELYRFKVFAFFWDTVYIREYCYNCLNEEFLTCNTNNTCRHLAMGKAWAGSPQILLCHPKESNKHHFISYHFTTPPKNKSIACQKLWLAI